MSNALPSHSWCEILGRRFYSLQSIDTHTGRVWESEAVAELEVAEAVVGDIAAEAVEKDCWRQSSDGRIDCSRWWGNWCCHGDG